MAGITTAALIGLGGSALATGASLYSSSQQNARAGQAAGVAAANAQAQLALQSEMMRQQREMQTATQTDANGNKLIYDPTRGWIPLLSAQGLAELERQKAQSAAQTRDYFGRQRPEEARAAEARTAEMQTASPLLEAIRNQYGAPTKEGVVGAQKIAGVTAATEPADLIKAGASTSALRNRGAVGPLTTQYAALDKNTTQGVRTALAKSDAEGGPLYNQILADWRNNKLAPYGTLSASGKNTTNAAIPAPSSDALSAQVAARAARPMQINPYSGMAGNAASQSLINAIGNYKDPAYGPAIGALTDNLKQIFTKDPTIKNAGGYSWNPGTTPWSEAAANPGAYNNWQF